MAQPQHHRGRDKEEKPQKTINGIHATRQIGMQREAGQKSERTVDQFRHSVVAPVHPWRVKHFEKHGIIRIGRDGNLYDTPGTSIEPWNSEVVRELVARDGRNETEDNFSG